jgi:hypothetical protein
MRGCAPEKRRCPRKSPHAAGRIFAAAFSASLLLLVFPAALLPQDTLAKQQSTLPEAPQPAPQVQPKNASVPPCQVKRDASAMLEAAVAGAVSPNPANPTLSPSLRPSSCPPLAPLVDWYARFVSGPQVERLTPKQKAWLATRDVIDPFNALTIMANSAIYVGANSHSGYGPGMRGFARNVGVSYSQDVTFEFFDTFLIPSIVHQDPHYHRLPKASLKRRIAHAIYEVEWTQGDDGRGMPNYGNLGGYAIAGAISNLYVPGQQTNLSASVSRYAIGLGTAPIDNFITEFLPDVARHIHVRVVLVQRIIDQVALSESGP